MTAPPSPSPRNARPQLSVVIPIYNGAALVQPLLDQVTASLRQTIETFEIILVDDGSQDESWASIASAAASVAHVRGYRLSRNFGQQIAVSAGIAQATSKYLIVMDGDLQNPPDAIPRIFARLRAGDDIVYTVSKTRNSMTDRLTSELFWFVVSRLFRVDIVTNQLMMRGMSRRFADVYGSYPEVTRTVAGISRDIGMRKSVLDVENCVRLAGRSGYNFLKRLDLMINILISLTTAPLQMVIYLSLAVLLVTVAASLYYIVYALIVPVAEGYTSTMLAIFFFGSTITFMLGIIGVYLANIYAEVRRRPLYLIEEHTHPHE